MRCAWAKFRELAPILTSRGASLRVFRAGVQRVLIYDSETWPMKVDDLQRLERTERMMVRWMCGVSLKNRVPSAEFFSWLRVDGFSEVVRQGRLKWFGHLECKEDMDELVSACRSIEVEGTKNRGRSKNM